MYILVFENDSHFSKPNIIAKPKIAKECIVTKAGRLLEKKSQRI